MASIMRCVNGHFYDANKSKECPYCLAEKEGVGNGASGGSGPVFISGRPVDEDGLTVAMMPEQPGELFLQGGRKEAEEGIRYDGESMTVGIFSAQSGTAYVTGWLVGLDEPVKGRDYRIHHGINWLGSSYGADIIVHEDPSITPMRHCGFAYDSRSNRFFVMSGEGAVYINGKPLNEPVELSDGDVITIGDSRFAFVPFCREGRVWS